MSAVGPQILFEQIGGIVTITLNAPAKGNAIDLDFARELVAAVTRCDQDASIHGGGAGACAAARQLWRGARDPDGT